MIFRGLIKNTNEFFTNQIDSLTILSSVDI